MYTTPLTVVIQERERDRERQRERERDRKRERERGIKENEDNREFLPFPPLYVYTLNLCGYSMLKYLPE